MTPDAPANDGAIRLLEWGLAAGIVLYPIPFASVPAAPRLGFEVAAFALLAVWAWRCRTHAPRLPPRAVRAALLLLLGLGLLQILPLPGGVVDTLSPAAGELRAALEPDAAAAGAEAELLGPQAGSGSRAATLSLDPKATASALRSGAAYAALLLVAATVAAARGLRLLATAALVSAAIQGLYGLLTLAAGHPFILWEPKLYYLDSATGTFVNRNHFAGYVGMLLCVGVGSLLERRRTGGAAPAWPRRLALVLLGLLGFAGMLLSLSRAGIVTGVAGIALTLWAGRRAVGRRMLLAALALALVASLPFLRLGAGDLAQRFEQTERDLIGTAGRGVVWADTLRMAAAHPVAGSGFGTFAAVYPMYRSAEVRKRFDHAHSDPLQVLAEGGLLGGLGVGLLLWPAARRCLSALGGAAGPALAGVAAGWLAMLAHACVDFPFRIPASAALFAVLTGVLYGGSWNARRSES